MDELEKIVLRDFVAEHWQEFVEHCASHGDDLAGQIYAALGGEPN